MNQKNAATTLSHAQDLKRMRLKTRAWEVAAVYAVFGLLWIFFSDRILALLVTDPDRLLVWNSYKGFGFVTVTAILLLLLLVRTFNMIRTAYTALVEHEREVERLSRLYAALSYVNQAIVSMDSRDKLFQKVCRILVERGGFGMAWIGWNDPITRQLTPVAEFGAKNNDLKNIYIRTDNSSENQGPFGISFQTGRASVCNDLTGDQAALSWKPELACRGYQALAVFPIREKRTVFGTLNVYSDQKNFFREKEIALLEEAAVDVSFAIDNLERENARRSAEQSLRDEKLFTDAMLESMSGVLFLHDNDGHFLRWNRNSEIVSGYSKEEIARMRPLDFFSEKDRTKMEKKITEVFEKGEAFTEVGIVAKNGSVKPYFFTARRVLFEGKACIVGTGIDMTEKMQMEAESARTTELLRTLANGTPDSVFIKDKKGKYLLFNAAAARYVGKSVEQVIGKDDTEIFNAASARIIMANDRMVMESGKNQIIEELLFTELGPRTFQALKAPYCDAFGNVTGIIGISRDVTELKKTESDLHLRDRAIQAVSQGILITDPNRPDNPIIYASAGFERMTGYRAEEVIGKNCRFLQGADTNPGTVKEMRAAITAERSCQIEILNYRKDGTPFWNRLTISPVLGSAGEVTHFVGVQEDVTEKRHLEGQLRQAQKMEDFGQLAGGVAHDFNNLLTVISGYSGLILSKISKQDPLWEFVTAISDAGARAAALTRQMLAFSRKTVLAPKVLNLNSVVSETEKMLRRLIGEDIVLTTVFNPDIHLVKVDPTHLGQVLMNLVVNARDAMPKGGKMTIETGNFTLDERGAASRTGVSPGDYAMLSVRDTGCGMSPEVKARIYEPFFTTKSEGKGTGLGLAVVHGIMKQSGGLIEVESEEGVGTVFKLYFPAVKGEPGTESSESVNKKNSRGDETVLLVEDEEIVRGFTALALVTQGYRVLSAGNGQEAIEVAGKEGGQISILISDVVMPGMSGVELAKVLSDRFPKMKTLFLSGYANDAILRHGVLNEKTAFLQKPFSPDDLAKKVREVLSA